MNIFSVELHTFVVTYLVIASTLATVGFLVFKRDTARLSNIFFLLMNLGTALWMASFAAQISNFPLVGRGALNDVLPYFFGGAVPPLMLFFALTFTRNRIVISNAILAVVLVPYAVLATLMYVLPNTFIYTSESGIGGLLYWIYVLYIFGFVLAAFRLLVRKYYASAGVFKSVLRSLVVGVFAAGTVILVTGFLNDLYGLEIFRLVQYVSILLLSIYVGYRIMQYYRWRLKPFVAELFVAFITYILIAQTLFMETVFGVAMNILVLVLFTVSGYFLVKSIVHESKAKDEIEKLVKDLTEANEQLQLLDRRKSEFVKISAHHLKAPLTAIKGYASMTLEGSFGKEINNDAKEAIQKIYDASERLVAIISDFMDISNIESGKMEYTFEKVNLKKLIEGVLEEMKMVVEKSGLDVSFNTDAIDGYIVHVDPGKLRQVISNLTDNAIKYTPQGHVHLFLKKEKEKKKLHLTITDTGIGMSQETIDNLFEKFSRAHDANKVNTGGSGLGLYVAKEIMKKHNARIWVESPGEGKGSTFHLVFDAA